MIAMEKVPKITEDESPTVSVEENLERLRILAREEVLKLRKMAYEDTLTGLPNRRAYERVLSEFLDGNHSSELDEFLDILEGGERQVENDQRSNPEQLGKASVLVLDIDHFGKFNNLYGHEIGDLVLKEFAKAVHSVTREDRDIAFRFGGEEFVILCPNTDETDALKISERIKNAVKEMKVMVEGYKDPLSVTVSIGVAQVVDQVMVGGEHPEYPEEKLREVSRTDVERAIAKADIALYAAKEEGRDLVRIASDDWPDFSYDEDQKEKVS